MSSETRPLSPAAPAASWLAILCCVVWPVAAASTGTFGIWLPIGATAIALGAAVLLFDRAATRRLLAPRARLVLIGATVGIVMAAGTYLLYPPFARRLPFIATDAAALYLSFRAPPPVVAALALLPVILGEELAWRGVVQTVLARRLGQWRGMALAALVYALAHAPLGSPLLVGLALSCGLVWGALRVATASLIPTLLAHVVWDALVLLWLPLDAH